MSEQIFVSIRRPFNAFHLRRPGTGIGALIVFALISSGCGPHASNDPSDQNSDRRMLGWATSQLGLDTGSGLAFTPRIAVEPDPADNDGAGPDDSASSAFAVWLERVDLDPADFLPPVYHAYASRWDGTNWGPPTVVDTGSLDFHAWEPQISMDKTGSAVVVWQQHDGTAQRVYARRYVMGSGWDLIAKRLNDTAEFSDLHAAGPSIAVEPDGGGSAMAVWLQVAETDWQRIFESASRPSRNPSAAAGTNWTNATAVSASDNTYAVYNNTLQDDLCITGFNMAVSASAVITGIVVQVEGNGTSAAAVDRQYRIGLTKSGCVPAGTIKTGVTLGQSTDTGNSNGNLDDLWGTTWTPSELSAATFGVLISDNDTTAAALNIDQVTVTAVTSELQCPGGSGNLCSSVNALTVYNGRLYAGMGDNTDGSADVYVFDGGVWSASLDEVDVDATDDQTDGIRSMAPHNGKLYAGTGDVHTIHFGGDLRVFDGNSWTTLVTNNLSCGAAPCANVGGAPTYNAISSMISYQCPACPGSFLYVGMGMSTDGDGDVWRCAVCDGSDWVKVWESPALPSPNYYGTVNAMAVYQCSGCPFPQLYVAFGSLSSTTTADVKRCTVCDGSDWATVVNNSTTYESVRSLAVHGGRLYIGLGDDSGEGDILRCTLCDGVTAGDLQTVFTDGGSTTYEKVLSMNSYGGSLYIGLGDSAPGDGDIKRCSACDGTDWFDSRNDGVAPYAADYEKVSSLSVYNGFLFAGAGLSGNDGDIFRLSSGWHTVARRFSGTWDTTDALCPPNSGAIDGICFISGGATFTSNENPVVAMDDTGRATAAFIRFDPVNCSQGGGSASTPAAVININIVCRAAKVLAARFNLGPWGAPANLTPAQNIVDPGSFTNAFGLSGLVVNENCEDWGDTITNIENEVVKLSSACLNVSDLHVAMDSDPSNLPADSGNAIVAFRIYERALLSNADIIDVLNQPPLDLLDAHERKAVFVRRYSGSTGSWDLSATTGIADYEYSPSVMDAVAPISDCASLTDADANEDHVMIMNCDLASLALAVKPDDGARAMVAYERYVGPVYDGLGFLITPAVRDIVVHRYNGAAFGTVPDADNCANDVLTCWHNVDAGAGEAHAPSLAMDNGGNAIMVWTQKDGSGLWHVYANRCVENAGSCVWSGATVIDSNAPGENYFEPQIAVEAPAGNAMSLINVMDAMFNFRIDAFRWTPP